MSAVFRQPIVPAIDGDLCLQPMVAADLDEVIAIEADIYPQPWTRGNFADSLSSGYQCDVVRDCDSKLVGYFLMMMLVDEAHLLNLSVRADLHGKGLGRFLLGHAGRIALDRGMTSMLLEVRPTNQRALAVYQQYGFVRIGMRRHYYPAADGQREDAIVMRLVL